MSPIIRGIAQGWQLMRGTKTWKKSNNILQFFKKKWQAKKPKQTNKQTNKKKSLHFLWCVRFYILGGMFRIHVGDFTNSVQAWDSRSMRESWQPWHSQTSGSSQTLNLKWARVEHFLSFLILWIFSSFFSWICPHSLPQFGPSGGWVSHLGRSWLRHCLSWMKNVKLKNK